MINHLFAFSATKQCTEVIQDNINLRHTHTQKTLLSSVTDFVSKLCENLADNNKFEWKIACSANFNFRRDFFVFDLLKDVIIDTLVVKYSLIQTTIENTVVLFLTLTPSDFLAKSLLISKTPSLAILGHYLVSWTMLLMTSYLHINYFKSVIVTIQLETVHLLCFSL